MNFFVNAGKNLTSKIPNSTKSFESYLINCNSVMGEADLTIEELRTSFLTLQSNKSPGIDEISVNVLKRTYDIIEPTLLHIFGVSIKTGQFPDSLKIARVTPIFKSGERNNVSKYRIDLYLCYHASPNFLKELCIIAYINT